MKRLLVMITILTTLFSSGITLAAIFGTRVPLPAFARWFTYPDGKPCLIPCLLGIEFGVTKWEDVGTILKAHPLSHNMKLDQRNDNNQEPIPRWYSFPSSPFDTYPDLTVYRGQDGTVEYADLSFSNRIDTSATFESMLRVFGSPQRVMLFTGDTDLFGYIDRMMFISVFYENICDNFMPLSPITIVTVSSKKHLDTLLKNNSLTGRYSWIGANRHKYVNRYYKTTPDDVLCPS